MKSGHKGRGWSAKVREKKRLIAEGNGYHKSSKKGKKSEHM